jgi:NADPH:quinone reductase-like Zn-dependent oxidoreductase
MKYKRVIATRFGGPEVLHVVDNDLIPPAEGEVRLKVLAASVCRPDVSVRRGESLYSGTTSGKSPILCLDML